MSLKNFFKKYKTLALIAVLLFLILESLVVFSVNYAKKSDLNNYLAKSAFDESVHVEMMQEHFTEIAKIFFDLKVNKPAVVAIMYAASHTKDKTERAVLRKKLYHLLKPTYVYFKQNHVRQFAFQLPYNISFLRFHKVKTYGDSLVGLRKTIDYVDENLVPISAYEEGRIFNGFRNIFPLFKADDFVGTVEISYSFTALQNELLNIDSSSYLFITNKKIARAELYKKELYRYAPSEFKEYDYDTSTLMDTMQIRLKYLHIINKDVAKSVQKRLLQGEQFSLLYMNKALYSGSAIIVNFIPIRNLDNKVVAYVLHYDFGEFLSILMHKYTILLITLSIAVLLLTLIIIIFLVSSQKKQEKIAKEATHDPLTDLYNRHAIDATLEQKLNEYSRYQKVFSLIFFDIDFFKKINDTYGHDVGDYILQRIATLVSEKIRESDFVGRWGGEEFLVILPDTALRAAVKVAQKLRHTIEDEIFYEADNVTCSFGVTEIQEGDDKNSLFKRVDEFLYKAKETGRNRVVSKL